MKNGFLNRRTPDSAKSLTKSTLWFIKIRFVSTADTMANGQTVLQSRSINQLLMTCIAVLLGKNQCPSGGSFNKIRGTAGKKGNSGGRELPRQKQSTPQQTVNRPPSRKASRPNPARR